MTVLFGLVSVVIPAYNRAGAIDRAIASVRTQTHEDLEIIVVDDGSTDDTHAIAANLAADEPRLRVLRHDRNRGAQAARNTGIRAASGEWVAFLDSDDTYLPDSVARRLEAAATDGTWAAHAECVVLRPSGVAERLGTPPMRGDIRREVLAAPGPTYPAMLVRRACLIRIDGLDETVTAFQEWDTAIRLSAVTRFAFVAEPTFVYDQRGADTISADARRSADGYEQVVRKHRSEIVLVCGRRTLGNHYRHLVAERGKAGDRIGALRCFWLATLAWPLALRGLPRAALALMKSLRRGGDAGR